MTERSVTALSNNQSPLAWIVRACAWFWQQLPLVWVSIILAGLVGAFDSWLFTDPTGIKNLPIYGMYQNRLQVLIGVLVVALLFATSKAISGLPSGPSERSIKRQYLARLNQDHELLITTGVAAMLMARRVKLEEVFIPLQFKLVPPLESYPLSAQEIAHQLAWRQSGKHEPDRLLATEAEWERRFRKGNRLDIEDIWQSLTREEPAAVIQGYPGMGKSTLLVRLTLHMARRYMGMADPAIPVLVPALIPIFVSLKEYADAYRSAAGDDITLVDFIKQSLVKKFDNPALAAYVDKWLRDCACLVLLDGLDEVSHQDQRRDIQKAINLFIDNQRYPDKQLPTYNRFLITSRVAGYEQVMFANYPHFLMAELTEEQIDNFLPRWCLASVSRERQEEEAEVVQREAEELATRLSNVLKTNPGVRQLAENPLLLTLMAAMEQNGVDLPNRRAELYEEVTRTLLESRNVAKGTPQLPEAETVQRLAPLAFKIHQEGLGFARKEEVIEALQAIIASPQGGGGSSTSIEETAQNYLKRVSERGGLFVLRTGDYYGFFHRTFEEYFAARHFLKLIELDRVRNEPDNQVAVFVALLRGDYTLWRETFLLAVGYVSKSDSTLASQIIRTLLTASASVNDPLLKQEA